MLSVVTRVKVSANETRNNTFVRERCVINQIWDPTAWGGRGCSFVDGMAAGYLLCTDDQVRPTCSSFQVTLVLTDV